MYALFYTKSHLHFNKLFNACYGIENNLRYYISTFYLFCIVHVLVQILMETTETNQGDLLIMMLHKVMVIIIVFLNY